MGLGLPKNILYSPLTYKYISYLLSFVLFSVIHFAFFLTLLFFVCLEMLDLGFAIILQPYYAPAGMNAHPQVLPDSRLVKLIHSLVNYVYFYGSMIILRRIVLDKMCVFRMHCFISKITFLQ